jgi:DNA polymerase III subunit epsilon
MFAIVDIETTGGYASANGITEIAIKIFDGKEVVEEFETLINPGQPIPRYIQAFTGISNEMVEQAPAFSEVAEKIHSFLKGKVFVAHNVNFDYSFVKAHLEHHGYPFQEKKLCTVRLARQILPGFASYSLGKLCHSLDIIIENRHRAGGDAAATAILFKKLLSCDTKNWIASSLNRNSKEQALPPNVKKSDFDALPRTPGVYYFHDQKGKVVYVGKAKDIRSIVNSHFSNNSAGRQKQNFLRSIYSISFQPTATELMACILESTEIKKLWPIFNTSQKRAEETFGIFVYEDQNGYMRMAIEKKRRNSNPVYTFHYKVDGHGVMRKLLKEYKLCPKLCFIQTNKDACQGMKEETCLGACERNEAPVDYNKRVMDAIASLTAKPSYVVLDKGLKENEHSCIMVVKGSFFGMGYLPKNVSELTKERLAEYINPYKENSYISLMLQSYVSQNPQLMREIVEAH